MVPPCPANHVSKRSTWGAREAKIKGFGGLLEFSPADTQQLNLRVPVVLANGYSSHESPFGAPFLVEQRLPPDAIQPAALRRALFTSLLALSFVRVTPAAGLVQ